ncbi:MAG: ECF transporter S component [Clostridia bacterium]|nr:ECF transporter S component [Clostridia bacterium]
MAQNSKKAFSAKRIVLLAVFSALAYVVSIFEFPIFPATPFSFLELDFGNVFIMLVGFLFGPIDAVIVCIVKEFLFLPVGGTGGVGQLANVIMTSSYVLLPSIVYRMKKGLKSVILSLAVAGILATGVALLTNLYILFPLYGITDPLAFFKAGAGYIAIFNLIKTTAVSVLTLLLYKRLSNFIKGLDTKGAGTR